MGDVVCREKIQLLYDAYAGRLREEATRLKRLIKEFIEMLGHQEQLSIVEVLNKLCLPLPPPQH